MIAIAIFNIISYKLTGIHTGLPYSSLACLLNLKEEPLTLTAKLAAVAALLEAVTYCNHFALSYYLSCYAERETDLALREPYYPVYKYSQCRLLPPLDLTAGKETLTYGMIGAKPAFYIRILYELASTETTQPYACVTGACKQAVFWIFPFLLVLP
ncbi:hypothetical protein L873DRAFT_1843685 [Choiromyces venosus 120613-1]|uniref:Uncharacterized protein n=1 Tax=Choiromyces venosus 120613-1 TaxID=1336337 RepID=A0A3N4JMD3_9PEZI|nr:hypothetical protein L873DRAFT_1843685 [Choiromyces venosus 120613-1]